MSRLKKISKKRGFLLLEVMVSVVIISAGLIYIVRSYSQAMRAIDTAARFLEVISRIEEKAWELEAKGGVTIGKRDGVFQEDGRYRWEYEVEEDKDLPLNIVKLTVKEEESRKAVKREGISVETCLWNKED